MIKQIKYRKYKKELSNKNWEEFEDGLALCQGCNDKLLQKLQLFREWSAMLIALFNNKKDEQMYTNEKCIICLISKPIWRSGLFDDLLHMKSHETF